MIETLLTSKKGHLAKFCKVDAWSQVLLFTGGASPPLDETQLVMVRGLGQRLGDPPRRFTQVRQ